MNNYYKRYTHKHMYDGNQSLIVEHLIDPHIYIYASLEGKHARMSYSILSQKYWH